MERLPHGTSEEDALAALGEPDEREAFDTARETWKYSRLLDEQKYAFAWTLVTFESGSLVDWTEYRFL